MTSTTTNLFRIPSRVTTKWVTKTVNEIIAREDEYPASVTSVEPRGSGWKNSDFGFGATAREYVVTIVTCDGYSYRKAVELIRGGGVYRLNLQHGTIV